MLSDGAGPDQEARRYEQNTRPPVEDQRARASRRVRIPSAAHNCIGRSPIGCGSEHDFSGSFGRVRRAVNGSRVSPRGTRTPGYKTRARRSKTSGREHREDQEEWYPQRSSQLHGREPGRARIRTRLPDELSRGPYGILPPARWQRRRPWNRAGRGPRARRTGEPAATKREPAGRRPAGARIEKSYPQRSSQLHWTEPDRLQVRTQLLADLRTTHPGRTSPSPERPPPEPAQGTGGARRWS